MFDVAVVGGSSTGLIAARELSRLGLKVCLLEEHEIGEVVCSGLISVNGLKELDIKPENVENVIRGVRLISPSNIEIFAHSNVDRAFVVDRSLFDKQIADESLSYGAKIFENFRVKEIVFKEDCVIINNKLKARIVLGCDGLKSIVARKCSLPLPKKIVASAKIVFDKIKKDFLEDVAEIYFRSYAKGFFAWILPRGGSVEVGIGVRKTNLKSALKKFLNEHGLELKSFQAGAFPVDLSLDTCSYRAMLVGNSAGQVKASTGGGVITGGICAKIASKACVESLEYERFDKNFYKEKYENLWKKILLKE